MIPRIRDRLGEKTYETIFNKVVDQCRSKGLVKLDQVMMDGSVIKANASIYAMEEREDEKLKTDNENKSGNDGDKIHSKDGLSSNDFRQKNILGKKISNKTHVNKSDPDATLSGKAFETKSLAPTTGLRLELF